MTRDFLRRYPISCRWRRLDRNMGVALGFYLYLGIKFIWITDTFNFPSGSRLRIAVCEAPFLDLKVISIASSYVFFMFYYLSLICPSFLINLPNWISRKISHKVCLCAHVTWESVSWLCSLFYRPFGSINLHIVSLIACIYMLKKFYSCNVACLIPPFGSSLCVPS